jgi:3-hydroxymyristoyl/3-hydroxydecanoyl-(acyl carrier protein) dehydratase
MPGVLIIEAMGQVAAVFVLNRLPDPQSKIVFFAGINEAKFRKPVVPGDQLHIEIEFLKLKPSVAKLKGTARVDGNVVAEAEIMATLSDRPRA